MADRHKRGPRPVRLPEALDAALAAFCERSGNPVNAVITAAVSEFLARRGDTTGTVAAPPGGNTAKASGATTRKRSQPAAAAVPVAVFSSPEPSAKPRRCPHPGTRVIGGFCKPCDSLVLPGGLLREAT